MDMSRKKALEVFARVAFASGAKLTPGNAEAAEAMERVRRHVLHRCNGVFCCVCQGGLALCDVCGGAEGSMPTECPGVKMTGHQQDEVMAGRLDFKDGAWQCSGHVASAKDSKVCGRCGVHIDDLRQEE